MRPADMNELDESRRWHELYGGNEDDVQIGGGGENGGAQVEVPTTGRRKKAVRSRKRGVGVGVGNGEGMNGGGGGGGEVV